MNQEIKSKGKVKNLRVGYYFSKFISKFSRFIVLRWLLEVRNGSFWFVAARPEIYSESKISTRPKHILKAFLLKGSFKDSYMGKGPSSKSVDGKNISWVQMKYSKTPHPNTSN